MGVRRAPQGARVGAAAHTTSHGRFLSRSERCASRRAVCVRAQDEGNDLAAVAQEKAMEFVQYVQDRTDAYKAKQEADFEPSTPPPAGVTKPTVRPYLPPLTNGFTHVAERWNSRAAMVGFFSLLFVELVTGKGLLELVGFSVGNGLGFEF
eukprot:CAMPEP_0197492858 /NCGR_PEP_ID=MMETSP1311-20131121/16419_1 /TAXON_ID=464262 /ORGANISM="Genus nov. species nov., Strain RCC856" /LENGTH=150 /DNA_ID=CAMNT_0043037985 /DNA_START=23 /DNA_END=475 /DNA_ORIENTATION=-